MLIRESAGGFLDARTGQPFAATPPADLAPVRLNNRLRRIVEGVLGTLTLLSPDPAKRLEAALAVFRSRDPNALPALEQAIAERPTRASRGRSWKRALRS